MEDIYWGAALTYFLLLHVGFLYFLVAATAQLDSAVRLQRQLDETKGELASLYLRNIILVQGDHTHSL